MMGKIINQIAGIFGIEVKRLKRKKDLKKRPLIDLRKCYDNIDPYDLISSKDNESIEFLINIPVSKIMYSRLLTVWIDVLKLWQFEEEELEVEARPSFKLLKNHFETYQPKKVGDLINIDKELINGKLKEFIDKPVLYLVPPYSKQSPEERFAQIQEMMVKEFMEHGKNEYRPEDGWKAFGPSSLKLIKIEYLRLTKIFDILKRDGYDFKYGYLNLDVFTSENHTLYMTKGGWHRTAAMIALGYEYIPVRVSKKRTTVVKRKEVMDWEQVKSGLYSEKQALNYFDKRFRALIENE